MIATPVVALLVAGGAWMWHLETERAAQVEHARVVFEPAQKALRPADDVEVDIDKTIRVIHALDVAVNERGDLQEFLKTLASADYRGVAPDVLRAREKMLDVLMRLYAQQTRVENQEATFTVTRTVLSAMSLMEVDLTTAAAGGPPGLDPAQARSILTDLRRDQQDREELLNGLNTIEVELISAMTSYSAVYYKWVGEWDKVVVRRDRAYLAASTGNWAATEAAATEAIALAPHDTEAHLLKALAMIELSTANPETDRIPEALALLDDYIAKHPDRTAPALLLRGVAAARQGRADEAALSFEQSSAYYPRQADVLIDMLDPYEARTYLRRSREGQRIVDLYRATMLGAGAFSPDLQHARMLYRLGRVDEARKKVLDHFSRRRNQNRWDLILADVEFCTGFFGAEFESIYEEDSHLFLQVTPTLIGSKLDVRVENGSPRQLFNATLLLAVRFTDMHREDFEVFKVGETVPVVAANDKTSFGTIEIKHTFLGAEKNVDDIVLHRAIIVADDAVAWVDTDEYRLALARTDAATVDARTEWFSRMNTSPKLLTEQINRASKVELNLGLGADDVSMQLPRELAILNPVFRLRRDGEESAPATNSLGPEGIKLQFGDVANFDSADTSGDATLVITSRWGNFELDLDLRKRSLTAVNYVP